MNGLLYRNLVERYPELYGSAVPECGSGWYPILEFFGYWIKNGPQLPDHPVRAQQIKEKFGALRIYLHPPASDIHRYMAWLCSEWSLHTCEICGEIGERRVSLHQVIETRCKEHVDAPGTDRDIIARPIAALLSTKVMEEGYVTPKRRFGQPGPRPVVRLSPFSSRGYGQMLFERRERFLEELADLIASDVLPPQQLALLCVAAGALELARDNWEDIVVELKLRERAIEFGRTPRVIEQIKEMFEEWRP